MKEEIQKRYYTCPEIAAMLFERASCIRFWAKQFNVKAHITTHSRKLYTRFAVARFHEIKSLIRVQRFTLEGAKQKLK